MKGKRGLAILLALCMVLSMLPTHITAAEGPDDAALLLSEDNFPDENLRASILDFAKNQFDEDVIESQQDESGVYYLTEEQGCRAVFLLDGSVLL